jgi:hypothetical protein
MKIYALYDHPTDYPDYYVVRGYTAEGGEPVPDAEPLIITKDLDKVYAEMNRLGVHSLGRAYEIDPKIIDTFV